jgi:hypothetical protein
METTNFIINGYEVGFVLDHKTNSVKIFLAEAEDILIITDNNHKILYKATAHDGQLGGYFKTEIVK